jgi:hypothetical protein
MLDTPAKPRDEAASAPARPHAITAMDEDAVVSDG